MNHNGPSDGDLIDQVRWSAVWLNDGEVIHRRIEDRMRGAQHILLGEATHGSHVFYQHRADITRHLIQTGEVTAIAVESDWPDADGINRYVRGIEGDDAIDALSRFKRFPLWMWRNRVVAEFGPPGILAHGVALKPGKPLCLAAVNRDGNRPVPVLPP